MKVVHLLIYIRKSVSWWAGWSIVQSQQKSGALLDEGNSWSASDSASFTDGDSQNGVMVPENPSQMSKWSFRDIFKKDDFFLDADYVRWHELHHLMHCPLITIHTQITTDTKNETLKRLLNIHVFASWHFWLALAVKILKFQSWPNCLSINDNILSSCSLSLFFELNKREVKSSSFENRESINWRPNAYGSLAGSRMQFTPLTVIPPARLPHATLWSFKMLIIFPIIFSMFSICFAKSTKRSCTIIGRIMTREHTHINTAHTCTPHTR